MISVVIGAIDPMISTRTGGLRNKMTSGDHRNYSITDIGRIIENSGDLRVFAITQNPVGNLKLMLV